MAGRTEGASPKMGEGAERAFQVRSPPKKDLAISDRIILASHLVASLANVPVHTVRSGISPQVKK